jgi:N-acetyl-anhydromuramyl-L-alanine amidase AmpD
MYGHAASESAATMYADAVYGLLMQGYQTTLSDGEVFTQEPLQINVDKSSISEMALTYTLPAGCKYGLSGVDYPHAIDCVLNPQTYDCNVTAPGSGCTYSSANRPTDLAIKDIVIHDIEGTALNALNWFQNVNSSVSAHYIVDTNGLVYQVIREKDIAYQAGNWWYNEHSIGIEHAGYDATGYAWYNATEYLASARLTAYLLLKYHIPLDHSHIVSHGTIPAPTLATSPNHVDPGPYWLWEYYFYLIHLQGVPVPGMTKHYNVVTLHPATDKKPSGSYGHETKYNFNFFKLYQYPSTRSHLIPYLGSAYDITNETFNVEPLMSYYYVAARLDAAGTGDTMYEIWYGANDRGSQGSYLADARLAWLAVPRGYATVSYCQAYCWALKLQGPNASAAKIYGRPTTDSQYIIGYAKAGSIFISTMRVAEDPPPPPPPTPTPTATATYTPTATATATTGAVTIAPLAMVTLATGDIWYAINFNHRQAWVPASEALFV